MRWGVALVLTGCGRLAFDARALGDAGDASGAGDGAVLDAMLPSGLVAWYPFDGPLELTDVVSGEVGTCSVSACPQPTPGHAGMGLAFDGDDCATVVDNGRFQLATITLATWARQDVSAPMTHVSKKLGAGGDNSWQLAADPFGGDPRSVGLATYETNFGSNDAAISPLDVITLGTWHHVAATYGGSTRRVYVDGVEVTFTTGASALSYDTMPVSIGCDDNSPASGFFRGALDDVQVYDRVLSATEIAELASR